MGANRLFSGKQTKSLWLWLAVPVIGLALVLAQGPSAPAARPAPTPTAVPQTGPKPTNESFLTDYDPQAGLFGGQAREQPEPVWQTGTTLLLKLGVVLGLIYLSMAGLRWLKQNKVGGLGGSQTIRVLETTGLGPNQTLHLVVVGEKTLLIGATQQQLSLISELADISAPMPEEAPGQATEFETMLMSEPNGTPTWQSALGTLRGSLYNIRESLGVQQ